MGVVHTYECGVKSIPWKLIIIFEILLDQVKQPMKLGQMAWCEWEVDAPKEFFMVLERKG